MAVIAPRIAAGVVSLAAVVPSIFTNDLTIPYLGVGISTIAGAALGTYAAIGYDDATRPRGKLFLLSTSTVIVSAAMTGVVPAWMGWQWFNAGVEGGAAALCSLVVYYALPEAIPTARRIIRDFKLSDINIFKRHGSGPPATKPEDDKK